jgi:hypothetical protein
MVPLEFLLAQFSRAHYEPGLDLCSNSNEYQEYILVGKCGRCIRLIFLTISCATVLKFDIDNLPELSGTVQACTGIVSPVIWVPYSFISFNCSLEPLFSFTYKAVCIVVTLPDLQFERHPISGA